MRLHTALVATVVAGMAIVFTGGCSSDGTQMTDTEQKAFYGNNGQRPADMGEKMAKAKADYEARNPRPPGYGVRSDGSSGPPAGVNTQAPSLPGR